MKYMVEEFLSYKLHMVKTNKFKAVTVKVIFSDEIKKEDITKKNLLTDLLIYSSKDFPTQKDLSIELQNLYALNVFSSCYRIGKVYNSDIGVTFLNEKYTEDGMFEKSIKFLSNIIFNPNVNNCSFDNDSFNIVKDANRTQIESVNENTRKLSLIKMLELMGKNEVYSLHGYGYKEDLENINNINLYEFYKNMINNNKIDIFIIGDIDFENTKKIVKENFKFNTLKRKKTDIIVKHSKYRKTAKKDCLGFPVSQAKLSVGCKIKDMSDFERNYVLTLYSIILGGSSDSKMFKNIREKNSLCYYISSTANKMDNLLLITSGITKTNFDNVVKLIKKEMKDIEKGSFEEEDIDKAKRNYISLLDELEDNAFQIISSYYSIELLGFDDLETRKKKIMTVTKEDIQKLSKKINIDTVFLLGAGD